MTVKERFQTIDHKVSKEQANGSSGGCRDRLDLSEPHRYYLPQAVYNAVEVLGKARGISLIDLETATEYGPNSQDVKWIDDIPTFKMALTKVYEQRCLSDNALEDAVEDGIKPATNYLDTIRN